MYTTTIPSYLQTIQQLLDLAFPDGVDPSLYFPLLTVLEPEFSERNLALIVANLTQKDYSLVQNDLYLIKSQPITNQQLIQSVRSLLDAHGYQDWLEQN